MIPFDIEYARPSSAEEAAALFQEATEAGRSVRYLSGGTELVTMARDGKMTFDILIDLKSIPETTALDDAEGTYGACRRLSELTDGSSVSLIRDAARGVADRTVRNSITLGGNVCGMLPYRETLLPFLLFDGTATLVGPRGRRSAALREIFDKRLRLETGEFLLSLHARENVQSARYFYRRRTRGPRVDYPLVTLCMARLGDEYRLAVGGAFGYPVRDSGVEQTVTTGAATARDQATRERLAAEAAEAYQDNFWSDLRGSADYRQALLTLSIAEGLEALGGTE